MTKAAPRIRILCDRHGVVRARSRGAFVPPAFVLACEERTRSSPGRLLLVDGGLPAGAVEHLGTGRNNPLLLIELRSEWLGRASLDDRDFLPALPWSAASAILVDCDGNADLIQSDVFADCIALNLPVRVEPGAFEAGSGMLIDHSGGVLRADHEAFDRAIAAAMLSACAIDAAIVHEWRTSLGVADWAVNLIDRKQEDLGLPCIEIASRYVKQVLKLVLDCPAPRSTAELFDACVRSSQSEQASGSQIQSWLATLSGARLGDEFPVSEVRLGDSKSILLRGVMLAVLRDTRERILLARNDSLMAGDAVVSAALVVHGLMVGLGGIDGRLKEGSSWLDRCWESWIDCVAPPRSGSRFDAAKSLQSPDARVNNDFRESPAAGAQQIIVDAASDGINVDSFRSAWAACGFQSSTGDQLLLGREIFVNLGAGVTAHVSMFGADRELWVLGAPASKRAVAPTWSALIESKHAHHSRRALVALIAAVADLNVRPCFDGGRPGFRVKIGAGPAGVANAVNEAACVIRSLGWAPTAPDSNVKHEVDGPIRPFEEDLAS